MDDGTIPLGDRREGPTSGQHGRPWASTGPAYEAIQSIGEEEFITRATELAARHMRDGLPLRGQIELFGYLGTKR